jgi:hypothetical protein
MLHAQLALGLGVHVGQRIVQFGDRGSERLAHLDGAIELHDEDLVLVFPDHLVQEAQAGAALGVQHAPLAAAGVHQQAERQRQVALAREIADGLRAAVFGQQEIVLVEIAGQRSGFVPHRRQDIYHFHIRGKNRRVLTAGKPDAAQRRRALGELRVWRSNPAWGCGVQGRSRFLYSH